MTRTAKSFAVLAVSTLACGLCASAASAAKHPKHQRAHTAAPAPQGETIQGVNPMTNAPAGKAVEHPAPYNKVPGVNPM